MKIINTALMGFGKSAEIFHAPFITINPVFRLTSVFERKSERSKEKYPFSKIIRNIDDILNNPEINLLVITTPNTTHYDFAMSSYFTFFFLLFIEGCTFLFNA